MSEEEIKEMEKEIEQEAKDNPPEDDIPGDGDMENQGNSQPADSKEING
jgi:hypothetical protein